MNIRKLGFAEWLQVVRGVLPYIGSLVRVAGVGVVTMLRGFIDIAGQVEDLFPPVMGPDGKPVKRSKEKREAFIELVAAGFGTAEDKVEGAEATIGPIADVLANLLTAFGVFKSGQA